MIRLTRSRKVDDVPAGLRGEKRKEKEMKLLRQAVDVGTFDEMFWNSIRPYWKPAREQLFQQTKSKCAYCESIKEKEWEGDVEHFRPKSVYWWLACCYDNYLFACKTCNSEWKGDFFPIDGEPMPAPRHRPGMSDADLERLVGTCTPDPLGRGGGMTLKAYRSACRAERPRLLDPYLTDPEPFFKWLAKKETTSSGEHYWKVQVAPRNNRSRTKLVFEAARDYYGLNRGSLQVHRGRVYELLLEVKMILEGLDRVPSPDARRHAIHYLNNKMSAKQPFAGMARYFVYDQWKLLERGS